MAPSARRQVVLSEATNVFPPEPSRRGHGAPVDTTSLEPGAPTEAETFDPVALPHPVSRQTSAVHTAILLQVPPGLFISESEVEAASITGVSGELRRSFS
ncbi:hypothetical protein HJFPF1_09495 [Paramyrothecium foliicola]|nr:hypothetical protein HJFPF1_09495 [Paramyrothecium foliicola]